MCGLDAIVSYSRTGAVIRWTFRKKLSFASQQSRVHACVYYTMLDSSSSIQALFLTIIHLDFLTRLLIHRLALPLFDLLTSSGGYVPRPRGRTPISLRIRLVENDFIGSFIILHIRMRCKFDLMSTISHHPNKGRRGTHVIGFRRAKREGDFSGILSILTGFSLTCSLTISYMKLQGAFVLMDPGEAWDREILYPPLSRAERTLVVGAEEEWLVPNNLFAVR
jgi:hypothetical protein